MSISADKYLADARTPEQIQADLAAGAEDWKGFETETLLSEEGARQILEHRRKQSSTATESVRHQPFRWKDKVFRIIKCEYGGGQSQVEVVPHDEEFVAEIRRRIENDRFHTLGYYQG